MKILGINSAYHESAASLIIDGKVAAAAEEERFSRVKHGKPARVDNADELPLESIRYCLESAAVKPDDLDGIAFSFDPELRARDFVLDDKTEVGDWGTQKGEDTFLDHLRRVPDAFGSSAWCSRWPASRIHAASSLTRGIQLLPVGF